MSANVITASSLLLTEDHPIHRLQRIAIGVGGAALLVCAIAGLANPTQLLRSYLVAFLFWMGASLGCLGLLMIQHVTGGKWGVAIRRLLESGARTIPVMALLFVPIALGVGHLYEWAQPEHVAHDPILQHKALYLNVPFFLARAALYFVVWALLALTLSRWSMRQDESFDPGPATRMENLSRGGLVALAITMSFAAVDWAMSLEPHWFSTIYGIIYIGGSALTAFALIIPITAMLMQHAPLRGLVTADQLSDLGKLMLAFVMLWAYFNFSQFLIMWSGNLPEEITWYLARLRGGWQWMALLIVVAHFALPFALLLSRRLKRDPQALAGVALILLLMRYVDVHWLITPAWEPGRVSINLVDIAAVLGMGGFWLWLFVRQLEGRPLLPLRDPVYPVVR
jgi:hypothetical protein